MPARTKSAGRAQAAASARTAWRCWTSSTSRSSRLKAKRRPGPPLRSRVPLHVVGLLVLPGASSRGRADRLSRGRRRHLQHQNGGPASPPFGPLHHLAGARAPRHKPHRRTPARIARQVGRARAPPDPLETYAQASTVWTSGCRHRPISCRPAHGLQTQCRPC